MDRFIVSARKYRPDTFETLIGQENIATTLKNAIASSQLAQAYLFCGPRGVGKTTAARIFAKTINCQNLDSKIEPCGKCESCISFNLGRSYTIHELDAASNNSVDNIRQLNELVRIPPQVGKYSVYIIDEVHMLSLAAFNAFLKTLEEPPAHAIFILATTEKHKILPTILSRCQTYDFNRISIENIVLNLKSISDKEGVTVDDEALHIIAQKADGAMRDALTIFDQAVAFCSKDLTYQKIIDSLNVLDYEYYINLTNIFINQNYKEALLLFDQILCKGFNALHFISGLSSHFRDLLVCKDPKTAILLELPPKIREKYSLQAQLCSVDFLYKALELTSACETGYKASGNQRLHIELTLIRLCRINLVEQPKQTTREESKGQITTPSNDLENTTPSSKTENTTPSPKTENTTSPPSPIIKAKSQNSDEMDKIPVPRLSIKNMLNGGVKSSEEKESSIAKIGKDPIEMERLLEVWAIMATQEELPRLSTAIKQADPILKDETTIVFMVKNDLQKKWIEDNRKIKLLHFLRTSLNNRDIELSIEVPEDEPQGERLYTQEEKAKFLLNNNPQLREMQKDLNLDIK